MNERILLHLRRYYTAQKEVEAPQAVTQKGIADAIDIRVTHVPRSVKKLDEEGLIFESVMHIQGLDKRRKAYFLTEKGMYQANEIKRTLEERRVPFKNSNGNITDVKVDEIEAKTGIKMDVLDLVTLIDREGILDERSMKSMASRTDKKDREPESHLFESPHKIQHPKEFLGRKDEVTTLRKWLDDEDTTLLSLYGPSGMGKTALALTALSKLEKDRNIFWFDFSKDEGFDEMLEYLSEFFTKLNRSDLKSALKTKKSGLHDILKGALKAISGTKTLLVFDSFDSADEKSGRFLSLLSQDLGSMSETKILILHTSRKQIFSTESLDPDQFKSLELKGLDRKNCRKLLGKKDLKKDDFERIFRLTEGNPLALKLIKSQDLSHLEKSGKYTKDELTLIKYLKSMDKI